MESLLKSGLGNRHKQTIESNWGNLGKNLRKTIDVDDARWPSSIHHHHHHFLPVMGPNSLLTKPSKTIKNHGARWDFPARFENFHRISRESGKMQPYQLRAVFGLSGVPSDNLT